MRTARPPGKQTGRDRARGVRRALVVLAASYAGFAGLGAGALAAAGGFSEEGALAREARGVGPIFVGEPLKEPPGDAGDDVRAGEGTSPVVEPEDPKGP